jgi:large subunit ribosomal protein L29
MKQQEITSMSVQDLKDHIANNSDRLVKMRLAHKVSPMENPLQIRSLRRTIARLKTELTKREAQA